MFYNYSKGDGDVRIIIQEELDTIKKLQNKFPFIKKVPVINDEADPLKGKIEENN